MKKLITGFLLLAGLSGIFTPQIQGADKAPNNPPAIQEKTNQKKQQRPLIQIAILLDTSNSMDGLIDQAKSQLWKIVNTFATTRKNGLAPDLRVALFEYGKSSIPAQEGYLRMVLPLTDDLDKVSEQLFALKTYGGYEYCGKVIKAAVEGLQWSKSHGDYKAIFIAGNEPFTQGDVDYKIACKEAITKSIIVNTIFCGPRQEGVNTNWEDGAKLADGKYMNINQNQRVVHIPSPYDKKITHLGGKLNQTYIPYGQRGAEGKARQESQDMNAKKAAPSGANLQRALAKSNSFYQAGGWDLVDGVKNGKVKLEKIEDKDLPREMQGLTLEQKKAFIEKKLKEREEIRKEIKELNKQRNAFVAKKRKEMAAKGKENTLDKVMIGSIKEQLKKKNFKVKE